MKTSQIVVVEAATIINMVEIGQRMLRGIAGNEIANSVDGSDLDDIASDLFYSAIDKKLTPEAC